MPTYNARPGLHMYLPGVFQNILIIEDLDLTDSGTCKFQNCCKIETPRIVARKEIGLFQRSPQISTICSRMELLR